MPDNLDQSLGLYLGAIPLENVLYIRQQSLWPSRDLDFVRIDGDAQALHLGLKKDGKWISCLSLFLEGPGLAEFRKFGTLPAYQGQGLGTRLFDFMIDTLKSQGVLAMHCSARIEKTSFYEKRGMHQQGPIYSKNQREYVRMWMAF